MVWETRSGGRPRAAHRGRAGVHQRDSLCGDGAARVGPPPPQRNVTQDPRARGPRDGRQCDETVRVAECVRNGVSDCFNCLPVCLSDCFNCLNV
eukprot:1185245-Prorocentrum_minimum.AAC.5